MRYLIALACLCLGAVSITLRPANPTPIQGGFTAYAWEPAGMTRPQLFLNGGYLHYTRFAAR